jgi:hypothetical protein
VARAAQSNQSWDYTKRYFDISRINGQIG